MAPKMATGTIALDPATPPALGDPLNFIWTADGLHGNQKPRIQVMAYQDVDGDTQVDDIVYGEAYPAGIGFDPLGGGGSYWLTNGGPAHCVATLYYWDFHPQQTFVPLATVEFDAAG